MKRDASTALPFKYGKNKKKMFLSLKRRGQKKRRAPILFWSAFTSIFGFAMLINLMTIDLTADDWRPFDGAALT